jgi:hypothetical protein
MTDCGDDDLDAIHRSGGVNDQVLDKMMSTRVVAGKGTHDAGDAG